ncbi:hypothetical protein SADUNF_Sadunf04G0153700 [Salix dunnii]|uniref:Uncharacterized protein n=1 Tax=Salix dunnii TaxID=1413687 RepID=A0A835KGA7_9ROSI|nr:hypothetical protein SADUNF_Sadunf04G0153700 [Salix dunnii]
MGVKMGSLVRFRLRWVSGMVLKLQNISHYNMRTKIPAIPLRYYMVVNFFVLEVKILIQFLFYTNSYLRISLCFSMVCSKPQKRGVGVLFNALTYMNTSLIFNQLI